MNLKSCLKVLNKYPKKHPENTFTSTFTSTGYISCNTECLKQKVNNFTMWTQLVLCGLIASCGVQAYYTTASSTTQHSSATTPQPSCQHNCNTHMGSCSCRSSCQYYGNCCRDYSYYCPSSTASSTTQDLGTNSTPQPSCRYNCGSHMGSCSCASSCRYYGNCCRDYNYYCPSSTASSTTQELGTTETSNTTGAPCGGYLYGSNGTLYSPNYPSSYPNNARCYWYIRPGRSIIELEFSYVNIESHSSCSYDAINVHDGYSSSGRLLGRLCGSQRATFHSTGAYLTVYFKSDSSVTSQGFRAHYRIVSSGSCRFNCGHQVGNCSCSTSCQYWGSCCPDYNNYCVNTSTPAPTTPVYPSATTPQPSCRYNCGNHMGSCSCASSCRYYGNCCRDYNYYCPSSTASSTTQDLGTTETSNTTGAPCGGYLYGSSGTVDSPNYPYSYPNNARCTGTSGQDGAS
ncbi:deleted in malignant brain tumors 1 protein-like isoform X2 [Takifugu flavidus]|uniref:deleted in malignant brain tumors 1 protein-like isoform X2 n=1 Tax=Takifugu flavidus TaxID=433684 RepID=UPI0025447773|nr:deleted in malignant brain tumors 1 protein-like isoform X2 [Takifugu flavidus]